MKLYLVSTSTNDTWEMLEGNYLVSANDEAEARQLITDQQINTDGYTCEKEVTEISEVKLTDESRVLQINAPIVE